jgi:signal transduction histidine kinase
VLVRLRVDERLLTAEVADDGIGIDERLLAHPPAEGTTSQPSPSAAGAPLGLFGMRERAVLLDGELVVQRRTDGHSGTLMRVTIPRPSDTAASEDQAR